MKKKIITALLAIAVIISFTPHTTHAQVLSAEDRASIVQELTDKLMVAMTELISLLQQQLNDQIKTEVQNQIEGSTAPLTTNTPSQPMTNQVNNITVNPDPKTASASIVINVPGWKSGVAQIQGKPSADGGSGLTGGVVLNVDTPEYSQFEGLVPDTYTYFIKVFNRSYRESHEGNDSDPLFVISGSFTIPKE